MATRKTSVNPEFLYIPVDKIVVSEQVRSNISTETESFKSLIQSIRNKGILEPLIVTGQDDGTYLLICGERRIVAARQLGFESVPVRVIEAGKELGDTIALQLTENLQREDLNPIDQAKGILSYIQARHPDKGYDVDGVMNDLIKYNRREAGGQVLFFAPTALFIKPTFHSIIHDQSQEALCLTCRCI